MTTMKIEPRPMTETEWRAHEAMLAERVAADEARMKAEQERRAAEARGQWDAAAPQRERAQTELARLKSEMAERNAEFVAAFTTFAAAVARRREYFAKMKSLASTACSDAPLIANVSAGKLPIEDIVMVVSHLEQHARVQ